MTASIPRPRPLSDVARSTTNRTGFPFAAVVFDCDGVLVESELITNDVLRELLRELGWNITAEDCRRMFIGRSIRDHGEVVEAHTGFRIDEQWMAKFRSRRNDALRRELTRVPHARDAVSAVRELVGRNLACATGADRAKATMQLELMGFTEFFEDRVFSGMDLPQTKPAPDVYLAAANALRCPPDSMAVIEDSVAGVTAGVAAGATVFAYSPEARKYGPDRELIAAGATTVFRSMNELPQILIAFQKSR